jgi:hypothetical protein
MTAIDPRAVITRDEDPDHLADTEIDPPLGWGADCEAFVDALVVVEMGRLAGGGL